MSSLPKELLWKRGQSHSLTLLCRQPTLPRRKCTIHGKGQASCKTRMNSIADAACAALEVNADPASQNRIAVKFEQLRELVESCILLEGHPQHEAQLIAEILLWAQLRGNNQGLAKIPANAVRRDEHAQAPMICHDSGAVTVINGRQSYGMVVLHRATQEAISHAQQHGAGAVGINSTSSSTGALGFYAEAIAREGLIGLVLAQSPEYVAPYGASEAVFGTNPVAVGIPTASDSDPIVLDLATSSMAWYGLLNAMSAGKSVDIDVGFDHHGKCTTDPAEILKGGALRNFSRDHKGSGLAFVLEILSGALVGGSMEDKHNAKNWGSLVLAFDPGMFGDKEGFQQRVQELIRRVKDARREDGGPEILIPGERGFQEAAKNGQAGTVPIEKGLLEQLQEMVANSKAEPDTTQSSIEPEAPERHSEMSSNCTQSQNQPGMTQSAANSHLTPELTTAKIDAQDEFRDPPSPPPGLPAISTATRLLHPPQAVQDPYYASSPPIYQTATFAQPSATDCGPYDYSRSGNPTRTLLEGQIADLEGASRSFAFVSGMAALSAVLRTIACGDHIVAGDDLYGGTSRLLAQVAPNLGLDVTHVDTTEIESFKKALRPGKTKLVMLESPTNPRMQVCDLQLFTNAAHEAGALVAVDNSIMTFLYQRPLDMGADISMTSATKFIGGHSDVMAGLLSIKDEKLAQRVYFHQNAEGNGLGPFDCWLLLRGVKTMGIRMERQISNCQRIADFLEKHPLVKKINYPGLAQHSRSDVQCRQAKNGGSLLSFETGSLEASRVLVEQTKLFKVTVSFGNVTSQISLPCFMSHASIPADVRAARGLPDDLVRISTGIEECDDLIADLDQALNQACQRVGMKHESRQRSARNNPSREQQLLQRVSELEDELSRAS